MRWLLLVQQIDWIVITVSWPVCTTTQTKETTFPFSNKAHYHAILVMRLIITYCFFSSDWKFWGWHLDLYLKEKLFKYLKYNIKDRDIVRNPAIYNMLWIIEQNCPVVQATKLTSALFYWKCSCNETRTIINASIWACCLFHLIRSWNGYNIHSSPAITEVLLFHKRLMKIYKLEKGLHLLLTSFFPNEHFYLFPKSLSLLLFIDQSPNFISNSQNPIDEHAFGKKGGFWCLFSLLDCHSVILILSL